MPFFRMVGIVPLGIGLTLLIALWWPGSSFAFAPFFFKIFGSFVALMFILVGSRFVSGFGGPQSQLKSMISEMQKLQQEQGLKPSQETQSPDVAGYQCSACGAALDKDAEVSPHGDVKCEHCGRWFNIHKRQS